MVKWLNKLYEEKLLDQEFVTRTSKEWEAKVSSNQAGMTTGNYNRFDWFIEAGKGIEGFNMVIMDPPKTPLGEPWLESKKPVPGGFLAISKEAKKPERILEWYNYFFTQEGIDLTNWGIEGEDYIEKDGEMVYTDRIYNGEKDPRYALADRGIMAFGFPGVTKNEYLAASEGRRVAVKNQEKFLMPQEMLLPQMSFKDEDASKIKEITSVLFPLKDEYIAKFIIGDLEISEWDKYLSAMKDVGLETLIKIYQDSFDQINK